MDDIIKGVVRKTVWNLLPFDISGSCIFNSPKSSCTGTNIAPGCIKNYDQKTKIRRIQDLFKAQKSKNK